jgi:uncharacterized membrane protein
VHNVNNAGLGKSVAVGAAAGALMAMLGPVGLVAGAVAGGAIGGVVGPNLQLGFPSAFLQRLQDRLEPNHSALVVLVEHDSAGGLKEALGQVDGIISQDDLVDTVVQEMLAEHPAIETSAGPSSASAA